MGQPFEEQLPRTTSWWQQQRTVEPRATAITSRRLGIGGIGSSGWRFCYREITMQSLWAVHEEQLQSRASESKGDNVRHGSVHIQEHTCHPPGQEHLPRGGRAVGPANGACLKHRAGCDPRPGGGGPCEQREHGPAAAADAGRLHRDDGPGTHGMGGAPRKRLCRPCGRRAPTTCWPSRVTSPRYKPRSRTLARGPGPRRPRRRPLIGPTVTPPSMVAMAASRPGNAG